MVRAAPPVLFRFFACLAAAGLLFGLAGCGSSLARAQRGLRDLVTPTDASIIRYHVRQYHQSLHEFATRLYAKNPKYEEDPAQRRRKLAAIFANGPAVEYHYSTRLSHEILAAAFQEEVLEADRVYLLALGLWKSIREAYAIREDELFLSGLQVSLEGLQRLHHNLSQVNWRLKTCRDKKGELFFRTNEAGPDGYLNMGYEVLMTSILTRIEDDVVMLGGLPQKYIFRMSTMFMGIAI